MNLKDNRLLLSLTIAGGFLIAVALTTAITLYVVDSTRGLHILTHDEYMELDNHDLSMEHYELKQTLRKALLPYAQSLIHNESYSEEQISQFREHYLPKANRFVQLGDMDSLRFANRDEQEIKDGSFEMMAGVRKSLADYYYNLEQCNGKSQSVKCPIPSPMEIEKDVFRTRDGFTYYRTVDSIPIDPCYYGKDCEKYSSERPYMSDDMSWHINVGGKVYDLVLNDVSGVKTPSWQVTEKTVPMKPPADHSAK